MPRQRRNQCLSASHGSGRPYSDVLLIPDGLNFCLRYKHELKTATNTQEGLDMGRREGHQTSGAVAVGSMAVNEIL